MGHYRRVHGKLEFAPSSFQEAATAMNSIKPSDLKAGQKVTMSGKSHTYLGMTDHAGDGSTETHHFQDSKGSYKSYPTNTVPPLQSRDTMEQSGDDQS